MTDTDTATATPELAFVDYGRQTLILNHESARNYHVTICGCGTVGSNAAVQLAKAGFGNFTVIDFDEVENHNLPSQDFAINDLGSNKAEALARRISEVSDHANVSVKTDALIGGEIFDAGSVVMATDSIDVRKTVWNSSIKSNPMVELYMDFRMGGNLLQAWALNPLDAVAIERYEATLWDSADVEEAPCGGRSFAPVGALSGGMATQFLRAHLMPDVSPPFYSYMDFDAFEFRTGRIESGDGN